MDAENYLKKFKRGNPNEDHAMADQIWRGLGKKISFPKIMGIIKTHGRQFAYETWNGIRQDDKVKNPAALFIWKVGQNKIKFVEIPNTDG